VIKVHHCTSLYSKVSFAGNVCLVSLHGYLRVLVGKAWPFGSGVLGPMTIQESSNKASQGEACDGVK